MTARANARCCTNLDGLGFVILHSTQIARDLPKQDNDRELELGRDVRLPRSTCLVSVADRQRRHASPPSWSCGTSRERSRQSRQNPSTLAVVAFSEIPQLKHVGRHASMASHVCCGGLEAGPLSMSPSWWALAASTIRKWSCRASKKPNQLEHGFRARFPASHDEIVSSGRARSSARCHVEHHLFPAMSTRHAPAVRAQLARWPERYQSMPLGSALSRLHRTARVYKHHTTLVDPTTAREYPALVPGSAA